MDKDAEKKEGKPEGDQPNSSALVEKIQQLGQSNIPQAPDSNIHVLSIIGQVEGHIQLPPQNKTTKYEHLLPQLIAIEQNPKIEGLVILLNTVGGDVEAGLALRSEEHTSELQSRDHLVYRLLLEKTNDCKN